MNTSNNINQYSKITRYVTGEMNRLETVWFKLFIAKNKETKQLVNEMRNDWNIVGKHFESKNVNPNKAWSKLYQRLENDDLIPSKESTYNAFSVNTLLKYAAVLAIALLVGGIGGYKYYNPKLITLSNKTGQSTLINTLPDGSIIYLAQNSTLTYPTRFAGNKRNVKLLGEAFFDVAKNPKKPFIIETQAARVKVLGTSFNLKSESENNFELNVVEGKVRINLNNNPTDKLIAIAGDRVLSMNNKLVKDHLSATNNIKKRMVRLEFQDQRLGDIINVINKTYGSNLQVSGELLNDRKISVTFENDISSIVNILSVSFNLQLIHQPDSTIILEEKE